MLQTVKQQSSSLQIGLKLKNEVFTNPNITCCTFADENRVSKGILAYKTIISCSCLC